MKLSLKMKLGLGFGTVLVTLAVLGVATYIGMGNIQAQARVMTENVEKKELTEAIDTGLEKQLAGVGGFLITNDEAQLGRYWGGTSSWRNQPTSSKNCW
jgi:CHASE3 domain sensor protein